MMQKRSKKNGHTRVTLADVELEMAKPRLAESVRAAVEAVEQEEDARLGPLRRPQGGREG